VSVTHGKGAIYRKINIKQNKYFHSIYIIDLFGLGERYIINTVPGLDEDSSFQLQSLYSIITKAEVELERILTSMI
jgi:hypothetical protein